MLRTGRKQAVRSPRNLPLIDNRLRRIEDLSAVHGGLPISGGKLLLLSAGVSITFSMTGKPGGVTGIFNFSTDPDLFLLGNEAFLRVKSDLFMSEGEDFNLAWVLAV